MKQTAIALLSKCSQETLEMPYLNQFLIGQTYASRIYIKGDFPENVHTVCPC